MRSRSLGNQLAIESRGLGKRFGVQWAVREVALRVEEGSIFGFLGLNGAGKTSTIRLILGLLRPTVGSVRVFGHDVATDRLAAARRMGALIEARAVYPALTGAENLNMARRFLSLPASEVGRVLEIVDLSGAAHRKVGHYSLGMRQRLGLARALLGSPGLLVLDEPMNGLDPAGIQDMRRIIRQAPERSGATIFLSSHLLAEVEQTATHIGLMHEGRLVKQGPLRDVLGGAGELLGSDRPDEAAALLRSAGYAALREGEAVAVSASGDRDAHEINNRLVEAGFKVMELRRRPVSLDSLFPQLEMAA